MFLLSRWIRFLSVAPSCWSDPRENSRSNGVTEQALEKSRTGRAVLVRQKRPRPPSAHHLYRLPPSFHSPAKCWCCSTSVLAPETPHGWSRTSFCQRNRGDASTFVARQTSPVICRRGILRSFLANNGPAPGQLQYPLHCRSCPGAWSRPGGRSNCNQPDVVMLAGACPESPRRPGTRDAWKR